ncbi:MAG: sporulation protein YqfD [Syntrophomonadaceae bacterium]|nr:sporulation protein YqfD [Syntrophomonadaceae bacterium]
MSVNRWLDYLGGVITVRVRGPYPEKIINLALSRGLFLSDIKRDGQDVYFSMRRSGYKALAAIAEKFGYQVEILSRKGFPYYRRTLRRRWMMLIGALVFVLVLYILSSFVWSLEVIGTNNVKTEAVLRSAANFGLHRYAFKGSLNRTHIEEGILREIPELSYVEVNIKGVKATIKVVEKVLPGDQFTGPCNLVAKRGGIVEEVMVLDGTAMVQKGDTVGAGSILISGTIIPQGEYPDDMIPPPRLVRAQGVVKARVWYEGYGEHPLLEERIIPTGASTESISLETPWGKWNIKRPQKSFTSFEVQKSSRVIKTPWGRISWNRETFSETRVQTREYDPEVALDLARQEALANLRKEIKGAEKVLSTKTRLISSAGDSIVRVKAEAEVLEDICRPQPLNMEEELLANP